MNPYLIPVLKASGAAAWEITEEATEGWEFYFVRHALDQHRVREVTHTSVNVYVLSPDGRFLGSASREIQASDGEAEVKQAVDSLLFQAGLVRNPAYTLHKPSGTAPLPGAADDPAAISRAFLEAMRSLPETETEDINSYEIFVNCRRQHLVTSEGIDLWQNVTDSMAEVIVNARRDGHEIELYRCLRSGTCDPDALRREIGDALRFGRDRLRAEPTPPLGETALVLSTSDVLEVYDYFISRLSTSMKYQRLCDWEKGQAAGPGTMNVTALRSLPNSSKNRAFDREGAPVRDLALMEHGTVRAFFGPRQYSAYLGEEDTFIASNFRVDGGTESPEALRGGPCLEVVEFSDFQVSAITGDIAGEIRLAYLHRDGRTVPVTGGSVSGNMRDLRLRFSSDLSQYDSHLVPAVTRLENVHVTGIA